MTERVYVSELIPKEERDELQSRDDGLAAWTQRLFEAGSGTGVYRQCTLGWHGECSQRGVRGDDCECLCKCHVDPWYEERELATFEGGDSTYRLVRGQGETSLLWRFTDSRHKNEYNSVVVADAAIDRMILELKKLKVVIAQEKEEE
jgi:hypothetical protein